MHALVNAEILLELFCGVCVHSRPWCVLDVSVYVTFPNIELIFNHKIFKSFVSLHYSLFSVEIISL